MKCAGKERSGHLQAGNPTHTVPRRVQAFNQAGGRRAILVARRSRYISCEPHEDKTRAPAPQHRPFLLGNDAANNNIAFPTPQH